MPSFLKFFVYENSVEFPVSSMSEPECAAIEECVKDLLPPLYSSNSGFVFDVETSIANDIVEEEGCGVLRCSAIIHGEQRPVPIPSDLLNFLAGKKFRIKPNQYGLNPWGKKIQVLFEALPPRIVIPLKRPVAAAIPATQVVTVSVCVSVPVPLSVCVSVPVSVSVSVSQ